MHWTNGFPEYPTGQRHDTAWLTTWHWASLPQDPGHGSLHLLLIQARFDGQSGFMTHSGRQFGGAPT